MAAVRTTAVRAIEDHVARALAACESASGVVLAVSGGRDSMVLLHAAAAVARRAIRAVATFDHGTGPHAAAAAALVREQTAALDLAVLSGVAGASARAAGSEAEWRAARWGFLRAVAADLGAHAVATAHTADDQLETVAMRTLRGAGARGLAALGARTDAVVRPLVAASRAEVAAYAAACGLQWIEDPSNSDRQHLRARVRADLLPAIGRVRPEAAPRLGAAAARAAAWREEADRWVEVAASGEGAPVAVLAALGPEALAVFWPAFAARAGVRLDRRAIARLVAFAGQAARRVRDGTVQPAWVPVAGQLPTGVALVCAAERAGEAARAWRFVVRAAPRLASGSDGPSPEWGSWRGGPGVA